MKHKLVTLVLSIAVIASLVFIGCAPEAAPPPEEEAPPQEEEVKPPAAPEEEVIEWRMATGFPVGDPLYTDRSAVFCEWVDKLSNGGFKITPYPGGTLCPAFEMTDAVQRGIVPIADSWPGYDIGKDLTGGLVAGGPACMDSEAFLHWLYYGGGAELWKQWRQEEFNLVVIPGGLKQTETELYSRKPVRTLEDFKGMKIRTAGLWAELLAELGASAVTLPAEETFTSLERGVIDATEWSTPGMDLSAGFYEICEYIVVPGIHQPAVAIGFIIDPEAWNSLSDEFKAMLQAASDEATLRSWTKWGCMDLEAWEVYEKNNTIVELSPEVCGKIRELRRAYDDRIAAENPWYKTILESQREFERLWDIAKRNRVIRYE